MTFIFVPKLRASAVAVASGLLSLVAAQDAWVNFTHSRLPETALIVDDDDPVALINSAQLKIASGRNIVGGTEELEKIVRRSVNELPINAPALRLLGSLNSAPADVELVRKQMRLSDRMARRDAASQLWLIEDAVIRDDIDGALRHYDTSFRISEPTRTLLYPVLADAMREPAIRQRFVPYVQNSPPWLHSFFRHALAKLDDPRVLVDLLRQAGGMPEAEEFAPFNTQLMRALVEQGYFNDALDYYRGLDGAKATLLTSLALNTHSVADAFAPISWQPYSIPGIEPYVVASPAGGVEIESTIDPGYSGPFARKILALSPGSYFVRIRMKSERAGRNDFAELSIMCPTGQSSAPQLLTEDAQMAGEFSLEGSLIVPDNCPVQVLLVSVRTGYSSEQIKLSLSHAEVR